MDAAAQLAVDSAAHPVMLFDGVCNLCNAAVQFVIDRDPESAFRFAPLQSATAQALLAARGWQARAEALDTVLLIEGDRVYDRSTAGLRIARRLRGGWKLLYALIVVPRPLRDAVYRFVARRRVRWFGQSESCRLPTPALRARFLE